MSKQHTCQECGANFSKRSLLMEHQRLLVHKNVFTCDICRKSFARMDNLERHMARHRDENQSQCPECGTVFSRADSLLRHRIKQHQLNEKSDESTEPPTLTFQSGGSSKRSLENAAEPQPSTSQVHSDRGTKRPADDTDHQGPSTRKVRRITKYDDAGNFYVIDKVKEVRIPKFQTNATYYKVTFSDLEISHTKNILTSLRRLLQSVINRMTAFVQPTDLVRLTVECPELDFPISLRFMKRSELTAERLLKEIERVLQSYEHFILDETLTIELIHVRLPKGGVGKRCKYVDLDKTMKEKRCFIRIQNRDTLCCARAIVTAKARLDKHEKWESIRKGHEPQTELAKQLHHHAGVPLGICGLEEIKHFQSALPGYQIMVVSMEHHNAIIYAGPDSAKQLYIYYHGEHFDVITSMAAFLCRVYFCTKCRKGYDHKEKHVCNNTCHHCRRIHEDEGEDWTYCKDCNRHFKNGTCFAEHKRLTDMNNSTCTTYYRCKMCDQSINKTLHKKPHQCGENYCKTCKDFFAEDHECYMQCVDNTSTNQEKRSEKTFIFFDFECTQDDWLTCDKGYLCGKDLKCINCGLSWCGSYEHTPNLCVVHKVCELCMNNDLSGVTDCSTCGANQNVFSGPNTTDLFCKWLFSKENTGATVLCHNFKGYDSYPILRYLHQNAILPEVITTGSKYMCIDVPHCKMRLIDSINFLPMALADLPGAFGIKELAKGYFPHLYNRKKNQDSILPHLPDIKFYNPDGMKPEARQAFLKWHSEHQNDSFNFKEELVKYCKSDVDILRRCCLQFRDMFLDITKKETDSGIDPFDKITIASACNQVFRSNFLEPDSIAIIPPHGYRPKHKQSMMAMQWLSWLALTGNMRIQHAHNGGEKQIGPFLVDGYRETDSNEKIVYEFHGCFWHGCSRCYSRTTINPVTDTTMADLHMATLDKKRYLEEQGYTYVELWECQFKKDLEDNESLSKHVANMEFVTTLEPRDAFYGGRTEAFKLFAEADERKRIKYYDVTSLYPYINKVGKVPLGHPEIHVDNFKSIETYEGLIKCTILPPKGLFIPVLPFKCSGKLMFSLCKTCTETQQQSPCFHSDSERAITGTWVSDEINKAIEKGYKVLKLHEVWHFDKVSKYNSQTKTDGVFTAYVNTFLKIKQQASGWPAWAKTDDDKQNYIDLYYQQEGILLEYNNIQKNPGLRALAKLMLNSFWGKFGQRSNLSQTKYISDPCMFFDLMTSDSQEVKGVSFVNDEMVRVTWDHNADFITSSCYTNVVVAAYTTAQARLKLYDYLEKLEDRVLYCDTDSIVFIELPGQWSPKLGDFLGDLTDETPNNKITAFVTGGPKNYAYNLQSPNQDGKLSICKVRGITLNFKNAMDVNFDTLKMMITKDPSLVLTVVDENKISRCSRKTSIVTRTEKKEYKIVFDKRVISDDYVSFPYGF